MEVFSQADSVLPSVSFSELSPIPVGGGGAVKEVFRLDAPAAELSPNPRHLPCLHLGVGGPRLEGLQPHLVVLVMGASGAICVPPLSLMLGMEDVNKCVL